MDDVSRLLRMARLEASLDIRCRLAGSTTMNVDPYAERDVPFHVLLEGECELEVGGELHAMKAGDVVLIPSGAPHRIITGGRTAMSGTVQTGQSSYTLITSDSDVDGDSAVIDLFCGHYRVGAGAGAILFGSLPTPTQASLIRSGDGSAALKQLSSLMRAEAERDAPGSSVIMSALCTVLIALVLRTGLDEGAHTRLWTAVSDPRLNRLIQEVMAHPGDDWSIERISRITLVSRATFFRQFQTSTGMTFGQFVTKARLMHAAELLISSESTVAEVAAQVGYQSESAFTRAFRSALDETPARFRKSARRGLAQ